MWALRWRTTRATSPADCSLANHCSDKADCSDKAGCRLKGQSQSQVHDRLAAPLGCARLRADFTKRLRILQVHRCRWAQEGPRLHEILEIPSNLELEALIDMDVLLGRNLTHDQRYSSDHVAPQIAGRERRRIAEVTNVNDRVDAGRAEAVGTISR